MSSALCRTGRMALFALSLGACGFPERIALPVPVPLTQGGTTVMAAGAGLTAEFGDGLLGQELFRTELVSIGLMGAIGDRVGLTIATYSETGSNGEGGTFVRGKVRVGPLAGPSSSVAVAVAYATTSRVSGDLQDEEVRAFDVAIPAEFLLSASADHTLDFGAYAAPRLIVERYDDHLNRAESLDATHWGILAGIHARARHVHLFAELTLLHLGARTVRGMPLGPDWMAVPSIGLAIHLGPPHRWGR